MRSNPAFPASYQAKDVLGLQLPSAAHQHHGGGRHARIGGELAGGAHPRALVPFCLCRRAAAAAELVRPIPVDELQRAAGEGEMGVVEDREERAQPFPGESGPRRRGVFRQLGGPAVDASQTP